MKPRWIKSGLVLGLALAAATGMPAQTPFSLDDCLRYAQAHSLTNRQQALTYELARRDKLSAACAFLPYIGASTSGQISFGRTIDPETNTYVTQQVGYNSISTSLSIPLFSGLANLNNLRMYQAIERQGREAKQIQADRVSLQVMNLFYNCLYYQQTTAQTQAQLETDRLKLKQCERMQEMGFRSKADLAQLEVNVTGDEFTLTQQQNLYELAIIDLKAALCWPLDSALTLFEDLEQVAVLPEALPDEQALSEQALSYLPDALAAQWELKSSHYSLKRTIGSFFPSISFGAGYSTSYYKNLKNSNATPYATQLKNNGGEYIALSLSLPIFTRLSNWNNYKRSQLSYHRQQLAYEQTIDNLQKEIVQAVLDLKGAVKEYLSARKKLEAVMLAHSANERKFEQGVLSALELNASTSQLSEARAQVTGKTIQYLIKKKQVAYYQGVPFIAESNN